MSNSKLSKEYISDSSDSEDEQTFVPPKHFHELKPTSKSSFKPSTNQEVWLFKLPTNLNLKDVSSLPISSELTSTTFTHNKKTYRITQELFAKDLTTSKYSIITPSSKESYKINKNSKIKRVFTISESVSIPEIDLSKVKVARTDVPKEENLRMRHFPTGYGAKDFEEATKVESVPSKKRKVEDAEIKEEKKAKKDKKEKSEKKEKKAKKDKKKKD